MRLRELRINAGMTQADLGKKMNVSAQTVLNWESGIYEPKIAQLKQLADLFGVTVDHLIEHETKDAELLAIYERIQSISKERWLEFLKLD